MTENIQSTKQIANMFVDGHKVTISFSDEYNADLAGLVRNTLLDALLRRTGILPQEDNASR